MYIFLSYPSFLVPKTISTFQTFYLVACCHFLSANKNKLKNWMLSSFIIKKGTGPGIAERDV